MLMRMIMSVMSGIPRWPSERSPQAELDGAVLAEVVDAGSDGVPVESGIIGVAAEYFCDICAEVEKEVHDGVAGCGFDFLHVWCGC